ncbi:MAG: hypothetical protein U1E27_08170, partial [Kiritimatiellia bacterium]|nr:hypothetical protein [Kiritimatiellia bacterium]
RAAGLCALWALPTLSALLLPDRMGLTQTVKQGASDALSGMQLPLLVFMLGLSALVARLPGLGRERWLMSVTAMVLPIFLHLKGLEMMGLWSQRRLLAPWILLLTITLSAGTALMAVARSRMGPMKRLADGVLIAALIAGLHNPIRWPAPYRVRYEAGADAFVEELERELQSALVFFDYHTHSLPLTVMPEGRVYGLSEQAAPGLPPVSAWLRERAEAEPVFWVTAYRNPGIEDGVRLVSQGRHKVRLPRVRAGKALPAVQEDISISLEILRVEPLRPGDPAVLDKVFELRNRKGPDGPQLGVRGPWGRSDIPLTGPDGSALPAQWTRSGSAVVGPVPLPGGSVRLVLEAAAARRDGRTNQTVRIVPPWGGPGLDLSIDQRYTRVEGILVRPEFDPELGSQTGLYRIDVQWPYDPSDAGISGFDRDLGVLLHRIRIERTAGLIPLHTGQAESGGE